MQYITLTYPQTASIRLYGYMYDHLSNVFLSSGSVPLPSITAVNAFSNSQRVSAICPPFSGYQYPLSSYSVNNSNTLFININGLSGRGDVDVILFNAAGYTKLSDEGFLIKLQ